MGSLIIQQDDCAPDSLEHFEEKFLDTVGITLQEFKSIAFKVTYTMGYVWVHKNYRLEYFCDDPFYALYLRK